MKIQTNDWSSGLVLKPQGVRHQTIAIITLIEIVIFHFAIIFFLSSMQDYGDQQSIVTNGNSPYRPEKSKEEVIIGKFQQHFSDKLCSDKTMMKITIMGKCDHMFLVAELYSRPLHHDECHHIVDDARVCSVFSAPTQCLFGSVLVPCVVVKSVCELDFFQIRFFSYSVFFPTFCMHFSASFGQSFCGVCSFCSFSLQLLS